MPTIRDGRIDKPMVDTELFISDPVVVFTDNGIVEIAWWDEKDHYWHDTEGETFGNVVKWHEIEFPKNWNYDESLYGGN